MPFKQAISSLLLFKVKQLPSSPHVLKYLMFDCVCTFLVFSFYPSVSSVHCLPSNVRENVSCLFAKKKSLDNVFRVIYELKSKTEALNNQTYTRSNII